jgi:hypothetical protein
LQQYKSSAAVFWPSECARHAMRSAKAARARTSPRRRFALYRHVDLESFMDRMRERLMVDHRCADISFRARGSARSFSI